MCVGRFSVEAESRRAVYLTWSDSEGEAVESSRGGRVRLHRSVSVHLIDVREPEVLLQRQPKHRGEKAAGANNRHSGKSCKDAQRKHYDSRVHAVCLQLGHTTSSSNCALNFDPLAHICGSLLHEMCSKKKKYVIWNAAHYSWHRSY